VPIINVPKSAECKINKVELEKKKFVSCNLLISQKETDVPDENLVVNIPIIRSGTCTKSPLLE